MDSKLISIITILPGAILSMDNVPRALPADALEAQRVADNRAKKNTVIQWHDSKTEEGMAMGFLKPFKTIQNL